MELCALIDAARALVEETRIQLAGPLPAIHEDAAIEVALRQARRQSAALDQMATVLAVAARLREGH